MATSAETDPQIAQLRDYLDVEVSETDASFCLRWIAGCALCPVLRWPLTITLGNRLAQASGRPPPDEDLVLVLARLPWFRSGRMPGALRATLAATLDRDDRHVARAALAETFEAALAEPGARPPPSPRRSGARLARLIGRLLDGELADPLLASGLRAHRAGGARARFEEALSRLPRELRIWVDAPRIAATLAVVVAIAAALTALPLADAFIGRHARSQPVTLDVATVRLRACGGPAGAWGKPTFASGAIQLATVLRMERVVPGTGFASVLISPDLSAALGMDADGGGTLWSLRGDGALGFPRDASATIALGDRYGLTSVGGEPTFVTMPRGAEGGARASPLPAPSTVEVSSREGVALVARRDGAAILVADAATGAAVKRIDTAGSPLVGIGRTQAATLVVALCDPAGKLMPSPDAPPAASPRREGGAQEPGAGPARTARSSRPRGIPPAGSDRTAVPTVTATGQAVRLFVRDNMLSCDGCSLVKSVTGAAAAPRGRMANIRAIVVHDTDGPATGNAPSLNLIMSGRPDLAGPLAHVLIGRDGTIYQITPFDSRVSHVGVSKAWQDVPTGNSAALAVTLEHAAPAPYPDAQLRSAEAVTRVLMAAYGIRTVVGHKEVAVPAGRKRDPEIDMDGFRRDLQAQATDKLPPAAPTRASATQSMAAGDSAEGGPRCRQGYVHREAFPDDFVCAPPESRDSAKADNAAAAERKAGKGPYGPETCVTGYVWREGSTSDLVCVTPERRALTKEENALSASRTEGP